MFQLKRSRQPQGTVGKADTERKERREEEGGRKGGEGGETGGGGGGSPGIAAENIKGRKSTTDDRGHNQGGLDGKAIASNQQATG